MTHNLWVLADGSLLFGSERSAGPDAHRPGECDPICWTCRRIADEKAAEAAYEREVGK